MEDIMQNLKPNTVHVDVNIDKEMTNAKKYIVENFFGYSAITLPLKLDGNTDYDFLMATDGKSIKYNPERVREQFQLLGFADARLRIRIIVLHEVYHVMMLHHTRRGNRDPKGWNIATDMMINSNLIKELDENDKFPQSGYYLERMFEDMGAIWDKHGNYKGMSAEQIFSALSKEEDEDGETQYQDKDKDGNPTGDNLDPSDFGGDVQDLPDPSGEDEEQGGNVSADADEDATPQQSYADAIAEEEESIEEKIIQADMMEKSVGKSGGYNAVSDARNNLSKPISWLELLRNYFSNTLSGDESTWNRYNRRYLAQDIYLPSKRPTQSGVLAICVDISGSVSQEEREYFVKNVDKIASEFPQIKTIKICYANHVVVNPKDRHHLDDIKLEDYWDVFQVSEGDEIEMRTLSGGGTEVDPFFNLIEQTDHDDYPDVALYFTDGYCWTEREDNPPDFPVVWASTGTMDYVPSFAEGIFVSQD
jgi:predicted metal-dependent peptidase